uniref:Ig-like domain-containing protein n=1 Tax=Nothobranchius furzeri TaxID=105023 RepID=A0A8C6LD64_NOTFU
MVAITNDCLPLSLCASVPPVFKQKINPVDINAGDQAKFVCETEEAPNVTFKWYKSGIEIRQIKYKITFKNGAASLEILDLLVADSGTYTCEVSNNAGSDSCSTIVAVKGVHSDNNWNLLTSRGWIGGFKHQRVPEHGHSCSSPLPLGMRQKYVMMSNGTLTFSPKLTCFHISTCHVVL